MPGCRYVEEIGFAMTGDLEIKILKLALTDPALTDPGVQGMQAPLPNFQFNFFYFQVVFGKIVTNSRLALPSRDAPPPEILDPPLRMSKK